MKNFSIILTALALGVAPVQSLMKSSMQSSSKQAPKIEAVSSLEMLKNGHESVVSIRQTYEQGGYDQFLKEMDDAYAVAKEQHQLDQLVQMRTGVQSEWQEWEARVQKFQKEKNAQLLHAIAGKEKTQFIEKVQSAVANLSNDQQEKAIERMAAFRQMVPGTGKNSDENCLIALDLEYEFKALNLDRPGVSVQEKRAELCALRMEKLDRMLEAAQEFEDSSLKEQVAVYANNFDARLAQSWDIADLNALANGKIAPANGIEQEIASILKLYQEKFSDMTHSFIADHEKK